MSAVNQSINSFSNQLGVFLYRFHVMIFTLLVLGGLIFAISSIYNTINSSASPVDPSTMSDAVFDKKTIDELDTLKASSEPPQPLSLGTGRQNGFYE